MRLVVGPLSCVCVCVCVCATTHVEVGDAISEIVIVFEEGQSFRKRVQTTAHLALLFVCLFLLALLFLLELHRCVKQACHANIEAYSLWYHSRKNKGTLVLRATCVHLHWQEERETVTVRMNSSWIADNTLLALDVSALDVSPTSI